MSKIIIVKTTACNEEAIKKVFTIKGRDYNNPLPIIVEGETMLNEVVAEMPAAKTVDAKYLIILRITNTRKYKIHYLILMTSE